MICLIWPSESTPKDPDTDASAVAKDVTVDAQDAADDMFGFDGAGSPQRLLHNQPKQ